MSTCIQVISADGKPSVAFIQLLKKHKGNETKALNEFAVNELRAGRDSYLLSSSGIVDSKALVNSLFSFNDEFSSTLEAQIRNNEDSIFRKDINSASKAEMIRYNDAKGNSVYRPASEKKEALNEIISQTKELKDKVGDKMHDVYQAHANGDLESESSKNFGDNVFPAILESISGLIPSQIKPYSDFAAEPWYIQSLASEKIMVHVTKDSNGNNIYDFIAPTYALANQDFNGSRNEFIAKKLLGTQTLSEAHGITMNGTMANRKLLTLAILASSINAHDPTASFRSARFVSVRGQGQFKHLDIGYGMKVLHRLSQIPAISQSLPNELKFIHNSTAEALIERVNADAVTLLFDMYESSYVNPNKDDFTVPYGVRDKRAMLEAVNRRIYFLMRAHSNKVGSQKEYEIANSTPGREMLMLVRAKEQLMMIEGLDYRGKNSQVRMGFYTSQISMQGEYANSALNLVFQEVHALNDSLRQRYKNKHLEKMRVIVKKFIKDNDGSSAKSFLINDTQGYYENLYEQIELRTLQPDGQLSSAKQKINIMMMKNPDDLKNNLTTSERTFIREVIALHKSSLIDLIEKKFKDKLINAKGYKDAEEWYNQEYKHKELLMPVGRKKSSELLASGDIKSAWNGFTDDFTNIYNLNDEGQSNKDFIFSRFGSATPQIGGIYGSDQRLKSLGIEFMNGEMVLVNPNKNNTASLNVEQLINQSAFNNNKAFYETEFNSLYTTGKMLLLNDKLNDRTEEMKTLKIMFESIVYGDIEKLDLVKGKNPMKVVNALRKFSTAGTLTLNYNSALLATYGANLSLISDALSQRHGDYFFNFKDYMVALTWIVAHPSKFDKLIDLFMWHESDEVNLLFSDKYQESQKGVWRSRFGTIMHSAGDRLVRGLILTSQLQHDGLLDNFIEKDDKLIYDWSKDKRNKVEIDAIKENLEYRGIENLPYDEVMMRSLTTISGKIMGAYTDNDKARFQASEAGKIIGQFKAYLGARATNLYMEGFENSNIRHYEVDKAGKLSIHTYYQEGIYQSFVQMVKEIERLGAVQGYQSLRPEQQANLRKLVIDVSLFGASALAYAAIRSGLEDKDKEWMDNWKYLRYAWYDIMGTYNIADFLMAISTPIVLLYLQRVTRAVWNLITLDLERAKDNAKSLFAPVRTFQDLHTLITN